MSDLYFSILYFKHLMYNICPFVCIFHHSLMLKMSINFEIALVRSLNHSIHSRWFEKCLAYLDVINLFFIYFGGIFSLSHWYFLYQLTYLISPVQIEARMRLNFWSSPFSSSQLFFSMQQQTRPPPPPFFFSFPFLVSPLKLTQFQYAIR